MVNFPEIGAGWPMAAARIAPSGLRDGAFGGGGSMRRAASRVRGPSRGQQLGGMIIIIIEIRTIPAWADQEMVRAALAGSPAIDAPSFCPFFAVN
jgi:hypothetical protein